LSVLSVCPVCDVGTLWPNGWTDQDETWHASTPRPRPHCVRWGPSSPSPKGGGATQFLAHICCGQMAGWIKMPLGMEVGLGLGDFVLYEDPLPSPKRGCCPLQKNSAHVHCAQTAGWIQMALGTDVGLSPGDFVRWGPTTSPKRGRSPLQFFSPRLLRPNGCMDQDATWYYGGRPRPRRHCVRWGPSSPLPKKGAGPLPDFRPIFIVVKRLDASRYHLVWW